MTETASKRPVILALFLILFGVIGWVAAFALTVEKFALLTDPEKALGCDLSPLVQCSTNLLSTQGALFGFPNPLLGLSGWIAPIVVGAAILAGARFNRVFWLLFNLGVAAAMALVVYLIITSIFFLGTLCPWCMVTWTVTIPTFLTVTFRNLKVGNFGSSARLTRIGSTLYGWVPAITLILFIVIAVMAQVRLDVINRL